MNDAVESDVMCEGFHKLDDNLIEKRPPKIRWGTGYLKMNDQEKIRYLQNLASTMNQAAFLIQNERNALGELCEKKELQLESLTETARLAQSTMTNHLSRMNEERQHFNQAVSKLKAEIRSLKAS